MVIVSPLSRVIPLTNRRFMAYKWGLLTTYNWDDPPSGQLVGKHTIRPMDLMVTNMFVRYRVHGGILTLSSMDTAYVRESPPPKTAEHKVQYLQMRYLNSFNIATGKWWLEDDPFLLCPGNFSVGELLNFGGGG